MPGRCSSKSIHYVKCAVHIACGNRHTAVVDGAGAVHVFSLLCMLQVATDTRLWLMQQVQTMREAMADLLRVAVDRAEREVDILLPGYTHLQPAMTVRWGHWLMSHAAAWQRDDMRLRDLTPRVAMMPLGSGKPWTQLAWHARPTTMPLMLRASHQASIDRAPCHATFMGHFSWHLSVSCA